MNITDKTKIDNINKGKLSRDIGMVYGSFYKSGKVYTDLTWIGLMPLEKGGNKLGDIIKHKEKEIEKLKNKIEKLEMKIETISNVFYEYLKDEEDSMREDF